MSVSILMVRTLADAVGRAGVDREAFLGAAGIEPKRLEERELRLSFGEYGRALEAALDESRDEALGLHLGESASSAAFDLLGPLTEQAKTLRESVEAAIRYARLMSDAPEMSLHESGAVASIRYAFPRTGDRRVRFTIELALSSVQRLIRFFAGASSQLLAVGFPYPAPTYAAEYARIFGGAERFEHPFTGVELPREWLDRSHLFNNPELYSVLESQAESALERVGRERSVARRVSDHIAARDLSKVPTMEGIARALGMSARTLRRHLLGEGVAYRDLIERERERVAKRALVRPGTSIKETAFALGFATPAAFHRAFKRWTGVTPQKYRMEQ